jgi:hypothetical protein
MTPHPPDNDSPATLWRFVPLPEYEVPPAPAREAATRGVSELWRRIRGREPAGPHRAQEQLGDFSDAALARLVPPIDWRPAAEALDRRLEGWPAPDGRGPWIHIVVGAPFGGRSEIIRLWSRTRGWKTVAPPAPDRILSGDADWLSQWEGQDRPWVLPALERCYLRHANGLALARVFLERALSGELGPGLVGCDSWAWAFLRKVWRAPRLEAVTLQAFDENGLRDVLRSPTAGLGLARFRDADTGKDVLPGHDAGEDGTDGPYPFLTQLAAESRGNLGVARAIWRSRLRSAPEGETEGEGARNTREAPEPGATVWVRSTVKEPSVPGALERESAFVLHCLLLHDGLPADLLADLLPLLQGTAAATLLRLSAAGLVEEHRRVWRVTSLGYPAVRHFLHGNGYLVDPL